MNNWIDVNERLPEPTSGECKVLVASSYGVVTAWFSSNVFQDCDTNNDEGMFDWSGNEFVVTHWMPLPEAPCQD